MFASSARPLLRRQAASLQARSLATSAAPSGFTRIRSGILSTVLVLGTGAFIFYAQDSRAGVHKLVKLSYQMNLV